jgi:hypothetical protein
MKHITLFLIASAILGMLAATQKVCADVAYDNFPARHNQGIGYQVGQSGTPLATQFQSQTTGVLDRITFAVGSRPSAANFTAKLYTDSANNLGSLLDQWTGVATSVTVNGLATVVDFDHSVFLNAGQLYWLQTSSSATDVIWCYPNPGATGRIAFGGNTFTGQPLPAFAVLVTPEPSAAFLAAFACLAGAKFVRQRRRHGR